MRWNKGAACALVLVALTAFAPSAAATTSEACRDGNRRTAQAIDDDIRIVDDDGWYYVMTSGTATSAWKESNQVAGLQTERRVCEVSEIDGVTYTLLYTYVKWEADTSLASLQVGTSGASAQACFCIA